MQHRILTAKRFPSDLKDYHQPAPGQGLVSIVKSFAEGISSATEAFASFTKRTSYSFISLIPRKSPNPDLPSKEQRKGKGPSKVTLKLIEQINKGFDPLKLSRQRWLIEQEEERKQQRQKVSQLIDKYQAYMNKENQSEKVNTKDIKTIRVDKQEEPAVDSYLWFIAQENLNFYKKKVENWKRKQNGQNALLSTVQVPTTEKQLAIEQPAPPSQQDFSSKQITDQPPQVYPNESQASSDLPNLKVVQLNHQKILQSAQNSSLIATKTTEPQLPSSSHEAQAQNKAKQNPFLSVSVPQKVNLMDIILKNSSNLFSQSNNSQPNRTETNQKQPKPAFGNPPPLFKQLQHQTNATSSTANRSKPNFSDIFGISSIKKEAVTSQPALLNRISPFGSGFSSSNTQLSNSQSQGNGHSQQQVGIFPRVPERGSENLKQIMDMFGKRAPEGSSLFSDAKSQRTEKKSMPVHSSRRNNKKTSNLRVS